MVSTINGRTPKEIKNGLECRITRCGDKECTDCNLYVALYTEEDNIRDVLLYVHQLEARNKEMAEKIELYDECVADAEQLMKERDAAVEQLKKLSGTPCENCERCRYCKHFGQCDYHWGECSNCISIDCPCGDCVNASNWQWLGPQEVE